MEFPETPLCKLAFKYGTDKCPRLKHTYTPFYFELLKDKRKSIKKVLELGIGHYKGMRRSKEIYDPGLKRIYKRGASLYMWRGFFPNATIFGADINPETMFEDERIKTYVCDSKKKEDLVSLVQNTGADIDLFIDDGSHHVEDQIFTCLTLMPLLNPEVAYIIEDVTLSRHLMAKLNENGYKCWGAPIENRHGNNQLVIIENK